MSMIALLLALAGAPAAAPPSQPSAAHAAPAPGSSFPYRVGAGETLIGIGERGLVSPQAWREVQRINAVADPFRVPVGRVLMIPSALLRTTPIVAKLESFRGAVTVIAGGAASPAIPGRLLGEGDAIETGANAFARLALPDGSHIALPSDTRVRLDRLRAVILTGALDRAISLQKGRAESEVTPMANPSSHFVIITPVAVSSVRGTVFRVAYDGAAKSASSGVVKGEVVVSNSKRQVAVPAGEGVVATPRGVSEARPLLAAPALVHPDLPQTDETVSFDIAPVPGAKSYRIKLANDPALTDPVREMTVMNPTVAFGPLPDGIYYAGITALTADGLEGEQAVVTVVRIRNDIAVVAARAEGGGRYLFQWRSTGGGPAEYDFRLAPKTGADLKPVMQTKLTATQVQAGPLAAGVYTWQVTAIRTLNGRSVKSYSDPQTLTIP